MSLAAGAQLGPYEVVSALGAGGMGEVYRARDSRLKRDVALKILPDVYASDADRLARFEREAVALAALNHPNIAIIHGVEDAPSSTGSHTLRALVLELVEGETLADRIARGPIPVREALAIARQIANALEAAHDRDIVHRDLKPANVKLTPAGTVKVLDFGLAKLAERSSINRREDVAASPTITSPAVMTGMGVVLGTAAYVAPEQARGRSADRRSDVWSFGCVLYEMLAGKRAFRGDEIADTLADILTQDPDWSALPADTPPSIVTLLQRCLRKDRARRLADIADARLEIEDALDTPVRAPASTTTRGGRRWLWLAAGITVAALLFAGALWALRPVSPSATPVRVSAALGVDGSFPGGGDGPMMAVPSPDGSMLAIAVIPDGSSNSQIFVRRMAESEARPLSGTDGGAGPFFSPDGAWLGFFRNGQLVKMATSGGAPIALARTSQPPAGGWWSDDGTIVFQPSALNGPLLQVSSSGGTTKTVTALEEGELVHRWPQVLPGGRGVVFTAAGVIGTTDSSVVVQSLVDGHRAVVERGGRYGRYLASGHLAFVRESTLYAVRFDSERLQTSGEPVPVLEGVLSGNLGLSAQFATSDTGTLVFRPGASTRATGDGMLNWLDRSGAPTGMRSSPMAWGTPRFSPDGRRIAVTLQETPGRGDIWTYDWEHDTLTRVTQDDANHSMPIWTNDGKAVIFGSNRDGGLSNLYWQHADGTGEPQRLTQSAEAQLPRSIHPSGKWLAYYEGLPTGEQRILIASVEGDERAGFKLGKPMTIPSNGFRKVFPTFSPDGRWLAFVSNQSGEFELYVRPFPALDREWQISSGGGNNPMWSQARSELFYTTGTADSSTIMIVRYDGRGDTFEFQKPREWSSQRVSAPPVFLLGSGIDLHKDGERFAVATPSTSPAVTPERASVVFIFNFFDQLRKRVDGD